MRLPWIFLVFVSLLLPCRASAFISFGNVDLTIDYRDFVPNGDGYDVTFVNRSPEPRAEFYIVVLGFDFRGAAIFRQRLYVDFLPGYGEMTFFLPGYDQNVAEVGFEVKKLKEFDVYPKVGESGLPLPVRPSGSSYR